jgi:hypothetical protein
VLYKQLYLTAGSWFFQPVHRFFTLRICHSQDLIIDVILATNTERVEIVGDISDLLKKYSPQEIQSNPDVFEKRTIETDRVIINDVTTIPSLDIYSTYDENINSTLTYAAKNMGEYSELIQDYGKKNVFDYSLAEYIGMNNKVISFDHVKSIMDEATGPADYWTKLYKTEPNAGGVITFSRVGLNSEGNKAFIDVKFMKGAMNGFIDYIVLEKTETWEAVTSNRYVYY